MWNGKRAGTRRVFSFLCLHYRPYIYRVSSVYLPCIVRISTVYRPCIVRVSTVGGYGGDVGWMWSGCRGDAGEMRARSRGDVREMQVVCVWIIEKVRTGGTVRTGNKHENVQEKDTHNLLRWDAK